MLHAEVVRLAIERSSLFAEKFHLWAGLPFLCREIFHFVKHFGKHLLIARAKGAIHGTH